MTPYEIMLSESQERMLIVAKRGQEQEVFRIFEKWDLDVAVIGEVTTTGRIEIFDGEALAADLPIGPLTDGAPVYQRPFARPASQDALNAFDEASVAFPSDHGQTLLSLLGRPNVASKQWVFEQYDHMVRLGNVVGPGQGDAAVVRIETTNKGLALAVDCPSRFVYLDPYEGARLAVAECSRNVSCAGGEPLGLTDCLNFGNPERPEVMWQFAEACRGIADACRELGVPVVSGNVSLYNETEGKAILPTPTVGVVGLVPDVSRTAAMGFQTPGDLIALLGSTAGHLGGSEVLEHLSGEVKGRPPALDLATEKVLQGLVRSFVRKGALSSVHDLSEGGLAVGLAECCIARENELRGAKVKVTPGTRGMGPFLFGEDASRVLVSFSKEHFDRIEAACRNAGIPLSVVGEVTAQDTLEVEGVFSLPLQELSKAYRKSLRELVDGPVSRHGTTR